jgi:SP family general alpha glucoside:H+ symporter-like MFS transporter
VLARTVYQIVNVISQVLEPYMMVCTCSLFHYAGFSYKWTNIVHQNPTAWNILGKTGFVWGSTAFCMVVWAYFRLPEIKGRTYEELDILFNNKVSARNFKKTKVDAYASTSQEELVQEVQSHELVEKS